MRTLVIDENQGDHLKEFSYFNQIARLFFKKGLFQANIYHLCLIEAKLKKSLCENKSNDNKPLVHLFQ